MKKMVGWMAWLLKHLFVHSYKIKPFFGLFEQHRRLEKKIIWLGIFVGFL